MKTPPKKKRARSEAPEQLWPKEVQERLENDAKRKDDWGRVRPTAVTLGSFLDDQPPPARPLIAPWLNFGESCLLWGSSGSGKSMLALTLAIGAAGGGSVLGWTFPNQTKVLYVDGEQSRNTLFNRLPLLMKAVPGADAGLCRKNLTLSAATMQRPEVRFFDIANHDQVEPVVEMVKAQDFGLVVFDNMTTLTDEIEDENDSASVKKFQRLFTALKAAGVAVILVHHSGKTGKDYRGSSAIVTTFERMLGMTRRSAVSTTKIDADVVVGKFRDEAPEGFETEFRAIFHTKRGETGQLVEGPEWQTPATQARKSWRLFCAGVERGDFMQITDFLPAYNQSFEGTMTAENFSDRIVKKQWFAQAGIKPEEYAAMKERMRSLREALEDKPAEF